jgi:hypothetical protein
MMNTPLTFDYPRYTICQSTVDEGDRLGFALVKCIKTSAAHEIPPDIAERLRFARERALALALASQHLATIPAPASFGFSWRWMSPLSAVFASLATGGSSLFNGSAPIGSRTPSWCLKLVSCIPLLALIFGFFVIDDFLHQADIVAAAEIDTALLSDDLSPDVYSNAEFAEFLRLQNP